MRNALRGMTFPGRVLAAVLCGLTVARGAEAQIAPAKLSDDWSTTVRLPPYSWPKNDAPSGECRAWVEQGWLAVERRTDRDELEWKIVLAKVVDDEPPKIDVHRPGALRVSYRDGRYFIRDEFGSFRCVRQPKRPEDMWPAIMLPGREPDAGGAVGEKIDIYFEKSWCFVATGPKRGSIDCLVRLNHRDLIKSGSLCGVSVGPAVTRGESGEMSLLDDGDILIGERLENWVAMRVFARRELQKKLPGSPAPELTGTTWLNTGGEPLTWKNLKGNTVLLVFFDLDSRINGNLTFTERVPALKSLYKDFYENGLVIVGVHTNGQAKDAEQFVEQHGLQFPVLIDDSDIGSRFGVLELPSYFLIDREGKIVWGHLTSAPPTAEIKKLLEKE